MAETRDSIADVWGERTPYVGAWPVRVDERRQAEPERWVQSACVLCSNGCGLDIGVRDGRIVGVRGRADDRVNHGRLGPKGLHGWLANASADRLTRPLIRRNGRQEEASWDEAMALIVARSREILARHTGLGIGFYTSGQLFLEAYYTLAVIGKAGLGTPHMDANTRLCTATPAVARMASFGTGGNPGTYADVDTADAILHVGHNPASQQTVLWMRILDRRRGPNPPKLVVIDPRRTATAAEADVHLAPRLGTNLAVMNGLLHLIIEAGQIDRAYIAAHTIGFERLRATVAAYPPERVEALTGIPRAQLRTAAEILGSARTLIVTALQGIYQSNQATAAAIQINNLMLVRSLVGREGCGLLQMNGQPTSQNTHECGCDGSLPGFRNWANPDHVAELARLWNVEPEVIPAWGPATHAMQIWRYAETGSLKLLWIIGTNPAVSLPDLPRIRRILGRDDLFVVAQDIFPTETTRRADVVLPAAMWGEKTGCFTNTDRTVHLSRKAVEPPGEARSDLDIFLDYARRMDFRDRDGAPLIKWDDPEGVFEAWKACSRGRPCHYSGLSYAKLTGGSGIQWPCNARFPEGKERLFTDGVFNTDPGYCQSYGRDLVTGAERTAAAYRALEPRGRAFLWAADYRPPIEQPDDDYPLSLTTGRVVYQWHTRTKTARCPELNAAAPDAWVQLAPEDAAPRGIAEGDMVEVESRRGWARAPARLGDIEPGTVFIPFHYGYWDHPGRRRAANELTISEWDPASKQPYVKFAAVRLRKVEAGLVGTVEQAATHALDEGKQLADRVAENLGTKLGELLARRRGVVGVGSYLAAVWEDEARLAAALDGVAGQLAMEPEIGTMCRLLASWSREHVQALAPIAARYGAPGAAMGASPSLPKWPPLSGPRLLADLRDLWLLASAVALDWTVLERAARALRDHELVAVCATALAQNNQQLAWLRTRAERAAPQALVTFEAAPPQTRQDHPARRS